MAQKIEGFSAGCPACKGAEELVKRIARASHTVDVLDMHRPEAAAKARQYGITRVPSAVMDGKLASSCAERGPDGATLRAAIYGQIRRNMVPGRPNHSLPGVHAL